MTSISPAPFFEVTTTAELAAQIAAGAASDRDLVLLSAGLQASGVTDKNLYEAVDGRRHKTLAQLLSHPGRRHYLHQVKFRLGLLGRISRFDSRLSLIRQVTSALQPPANVGLQSIPAKVGEAAWCDIEGYHHGGGHRMPRPKTRRSEGASRNSLLAKDPGKNPASADSRRYKIIRGIGFGSYASIHLAKDTRTGQEVVIKMLYETDQESVSEFRREYEILNRLNHPHIVKVFSFEEDLVGLWRPSIVMEYIDGQSLADRITHRGALPWPEARGILLQLASTLAYLHDNKVVHRDFKPAHVLLSGESVKIIDFGLAVFFPTHNVEKLVPGTPAYKAPEQIRGEPVAPSFDIYTFGLLTYEMLAGRRPFDVDTVEEVEHRHLNDSPTPPRQLNRNIPECAEAIILKALAKDPAARYQTMTELAQALEACP